MPKIETLVLATHNAGKVAEMTPALLSIAECVVSAATLGLPEPAETGHDFLSNARIKAHAACRASNLPALADDSGLCVAALNGAPGLYSAWWAGPQKNFLAAMMQVNTLLGKNTNRRASFVATLVLMWPDGREVVAEGRVDGDVVWPPRGAGGHGYDPLFVPEGDTRTFAEMTVTEKSQYSHRARALKALVDQLS